MIDLKAGDIINVRVRSNIVVDCFAGYDELLSFVIVAKDSEGFYLHIPHYSNVKNCAPADAYRCRKLGIDLRFIGENILYIQENMVAAIVSELDGLPCSICKEFYSYAEANQANGTLICFSCRQNPYR